MPRWAHALKRWKPARSGQDPMRDANTQGPATARLCRMKASLQPIEHLGRFERLQLVEDLWDEFAAERGIETRPEVLDELERRAAWRDAHPDQGKSLAQIALSLGVKL